MTRCDECKHIDNCVCVPCGCGCFELDLEKHDKQIRADAIDECIKTIIDYCGGLPNGMYVNALEHLKEQNNELG